MVTAGPRPLVAHPLRSSVLVMVLVSLVFTAVALTAFIEKAGNDLLVEVRQADAQRLRQEAFSALEVTLAVLEDFREADSGLHSPAEGWQDPLGWAGYTPTEGRTVEISFEDESGKIPLKRADLTTLTNLFEYWQMQPSDAAKLADAIAGWMQSGYTYSTSLNPDYPNATIPYAEPQRPLRTFSELAAVDVAKEVMFDENGLPNAYFWRFVSDCSIFNFPHPNVNGSNADVMAAVGQYTDAQQQKVSDYLAGVGQFSNAGQQWFKDTTTLATVAGVGGNSTQFVTTIAALRITITVKAGASHFKMSAVVAPQGGATTNQTAATNATSAANTSSSASTTASVTAAAQPSSTATSSATAAAASQSINYPFTLLELIEEDEIPQTPPPPPAQS